MKGKVHLQRAIRLHGGTLDAFAKEVLGRSRVSVWRWLNDSQEMPDVVVERLKAYVNSIVHPQPVSLTPRNGEATQND